MNGEIYIESGIELECEQTKRAPIESLVGVILAYAICALLAVAVFAALKLSVPIFALISPLVVLGLLAATEGFAPNKSYVLLTAAVIIAAITASTFFGMERLTDGVKIFVNALTTESKKVQSYVYTTYHITSVASEYPLCVEYAAAVFFSILSIVEYISIKSKNFGGIISIICCAALSALISFYGVFISGYYLCAYFLLVLIKLIYSLKPELKAFLLASAATVLIVIVCLIFCSVAFSGGSQYFKETAENIRDRIATKTTSADSENSGGNGGIGDYLVENSTDNSISGSYKATSSGNSGGSFENASGKTKDNSIGENSGNSPKGSGNDENKKSGALITILIALAIFLTPIACYGAYVLKIKLKRKLPRKKGNEDELERTFNKALLWLEAAGIDSDNRIYSELAKNVESATFIGYRTQFLRAVRLWEKSVYSQYAITETEVGAMEIFLETTKTAILSRATRLKKIKYRFINLL